MRMIIMLMMRRMMMSKNTRKYIPNNNILFNSWNELTFCITQWIRTCSQVNNIITYLLQPALFYFILEFEVRKFPDSDFSLDEWMVWSGVEWRVSHPIPFDPSFLSFWIWSWSSSSSSLLSHHHHLLPRHFPHDDLKMMMMIMMMMFLFTSPYVIHNKVAVQKIQNL